MTQHIHKGDKVKIISGDHKGTTAIVKTVLTKKNTALLEGIGVKKRQMKPSRLNPMGGSKEVHIPMQLSKMAFVSGGKSNSTSHVDSTKKADSAKVRRANKKEIK